MVAKGKSSSSSSSSSDSDDGKRAQTPQSNPVSVKDIKLNLGGGGNRKKSNSSDSESDGPAKTDLSSLRKRPTRGTPGLDTRTHLNRIEENPKDPLSWLAFAVFLAKTGRDNDRAERYFKRSILVNDGCELAYSDYGYFLGGVNAIDSVFTLW